MSEIRVRLPPKVYTLLEKIEKEYRIRKEDLILRGIIKTLEEFLGEKVYVS